MSDWEEEDMYEEEEEELSYDEDEEVEDQEMDDDDQFNGEDQMDGESRYFWGKELRQDEKPAEALEVFNKVIELKDTDQDIEYVFKSIKQAIKVCFEVPDFQRLIDYLDLFFNWGLAKVNQSYGETSLSKMLYRFDHQNSTCPSEVLMMFYDKFMRYLDNKGPISKNSLSERLFIRLNLGKSNIFINEKNYEEASRLLRELENIVRESTTSESIKNAFLLDVLAFEMIIATEHNFDLNELTRLTNLANSSISGIPQSRIVGIVNQCSGLVAMNLEDFKIANSYFQDSFKGFNECGDDRRLIVLIKFIISNLLSESEINPFKSSDFQGFALSDNNISKVMKLYNAVQEINIDAYNTLIKHDEEFKQLIGQDIFLQKFLPYVTELIQIRFIIKYLELFKRVRFKAFSKKLEISNDDLEDLLMKLFNLGHIGKVEIDLIDQVVERIDKPIKLINDALTACDIVRHLQALKNTKTDFTTLQEEMLAIEEQAKAVTEAKQSKEPKKNKNKENTTDNYNNDKVIEANKEVLGFLRGSISESTNDKMKNSDKIPFIPKKSSMPQQQLKVDAYLPISLINKSILEPLIPSSITDDPQQLPLSITNNGNNNSKSFTSKEELLKDLDNYLTIFRSSMPIIQSNKLSHLESVKKEALETEYKKLTDLNSLDPSSITNSEKSNETDTNIPEVLQSTQMNALDLQDDDSAQDTLSPIQLFDMKLEAMNELTEGIRLYKNKVKMEFKNGLKLSCKSSDGHNKHNSDLSLGDLGNLAHGANRDSSDVYRATYPNVPNELKGTFPKRSQQKHQEPLRPRTEQQKTVSGESHEYWERSNETGSMEEDDDDEEEVEEGDESHFQDDLHEWK